MRGTGSSPSGEHAVHLGPHLRLGLREWLQIGALLLTVGGAISGWLLDTSNTVGDTARRVTELEKARAEDKAERKEDRAESLKVRDATNQLTFEVRRLLEDNKERRQRGGGGPASEPPPAPRVPDADELVRDVDDLLRRLRRLECEQKHCPPEPSDEKADNTRPKE